MQLTTSTGSLWALFTLVGFAVVAPGCGDNDSTGSGGKGGTATGGTAGSATGGTSGKGGGAGLGGTATGGKAGSGGGGTGGKAGSGGSAGTAGISGAAGTSGAAGEGAMGGEGGMGEGGMGGEGGQGGVPAVTIYDFETDTQGWATDPPTVVAASADQHFDGAKSLKITYQTIDNTNVTAAVTNFEQAGTALWPGSVLTFHAFLPVGLDTTGGTYFQIFSQGNNYAAFDVNGNSAKTAMPGAWTTWTYTIPNMFPGGFQKLGFQLGDNAGGTTITAGDVYLDGVTMTPGAANCALATPTQAHGFETALDAGIYQKDGSDTDTVISQSTDQANSGTGSWKVDFTGLPAPSSGQTTRRVYINSPNLYCGQTVTVHVWLPTGSDGMTFQIFSQYNNYAKFTGSGTPGTVTRNGWTTLSYAVPATGADAVGPGGIQRIGVQFLWSGTTAFTGSTYVDDVTWGP